MKFKILDCTLRDGGFHTKWDFSSELVESYIENINSLKIDELEIGFRFTDKDGWLGKFAYTSEQTLNELNIRDSLDIGVMIFSGEFVKNNDINYELLNKIFPLVQTESRINFIRIATYLDNLDSAISIAKELNNKGYHTSLHLMKIHNTENKEFINIAKKAEINKIDRVYFADSLGSMFPENIQNVVKILKSEYSGPIGLHAHNNLGLAFINSVAAVEAGATWIDGTLTGIGRGPGNTKLEELLLHYFENDDEYNDNLISLLEEHFYPIQDKYKWGTNPFYFLAGKYNIHPSYLQDMIENDKFDRKDILSFLMNYENLDKESYNPENEDTGIIHYSTLVEGNFDAFDLLKEKNILIIGSGDSVKKHKNDIEVFIKKFQPVVFQLNKGGVIDEGLINYNLYSHPQTIKYENRSINNSDSVIIIPPNSLDFELTNKNVKFFGLKVEIDQFAINNTSCVAPNSLVLSYALAIAGASSESTIYFAGIDGYKQNVNKNKEITKTIELFNENFKDKDIVSVTPSTFSIKQVSPHKLIRDI